MLPSQKLVYGTLRDKMARSSTAALRSRCTRRTPIPASLWPNYSAMVRLRCCSSGWTLCSRRASAVRKRASLPDELSSTAKWGFSEAEAVHDLITARTAEAAQNAAAQIMGAVGSPVQEMRDELIGMVAHFHAVVDFPDEDIDPVLFEDAAALLHRTTSRLYSMAGKARSAGVSCGRASPV